MLLLTTKADTAAGFVFWSLPAAAAADDDDNEKKERPAGTTAIKSKSIAESERSFKRPRPRALLLLEWLVIVSLSSDLGLLEKMRRAQSGF